MRSVPAVRAERTAHGACATGAGEARVALVCRGTRTSWAELSAIVRVPRDARLRDARSRNEPVPATEATTRGSNISVSAVRAKPTVIEVGQR